MDNYKLASDLLHLVMGDFGEAFEGAKGFAVLDPVKGDVVAHVPNMNGAIINEKIAKAKQAQKSWAALSFEARCKILTAWKDQIVTHQDALAALLTWEQGKPLAEAKAEIAATIKNVEWSASESVEIEGSIVPSHVEDAENQICYEAMGVVAAITPWNFPSAMVSRKAAPALAAGCAVILKPAEDTPLSALALIVLAHKAGVPQDLFSVVTLDRQSAPEFSNAVFSSPDVAMVSFTGSTAVGKKLIEASAQNVVKLSLELGGNAPFIVCADADIDLAVEGAFACKYRNAGQTCICANRFFIHEAVYDEFMNKFTARVNKAALGYGFDEGVEIGPLINQAAYERVNAFEQELVGQGAVRVQTAHDKGEFPFVAPSIYACPDDCDAPKQEIFGPVACVYKFSAQDEVVQRANDTEYGLAAYVYCADPLCAQEIAAQLQFGMVGINETRIGDASIPFGGIKQSGIGREGGLDSLKNFMNVKYICKV